MIDERNLQDIKKFENIEKSSLIFLYVKMESENLYLKKEVDRLNVENRAMFEQLTKISLPVVKQLSNQQSLQLQRPPMVPQRPVQQPQVPKPVQVGQQPVRVNPPQQLPVQRPPQVISR